MYPKNIIKKIPGELPPPSKKNNPGYIDDLRKKQKFELLDLLQRQNNLLANKNFISKLPDRGEKIIKFKEKIWREIELKNEVEQAAKLLSKLNIASEGKAAMSELEWTGEYSEISNSEKIVELDSDDDTDPLTILAQPTGSGVHKKKIVYLPPEESLIKAEDLEDIESFKIEDPFEIDHIKHIREKVEHPECKNKMKKEPFKPYKTTKSNVHDPEKEKKRKKHKHWEVTAATPPLIIHGAIKTLSLNESLKLEIEKTEKLQEIQTKHATERLAQQIGLHGIGSLPTQVDMYRNYDESSTSSDSENEEHEVFDEEDNDKSGTVQYTVETVELVD